MIDLERLETQKRQLLSRIEGWPAARLSYRPSPESWSAAQIFDHLVKTEEGILDEAKRGLAKPHRIGVRDRLGFLFLQKVFQTERKVKAPASGDQVLPDESPELTKILQRWQTTRDDLASFQNNLSAEQNRLGLFRHPVGGWMGMRQIVAFFSVHMIHHGFQLSRISSASQTR